MTVAADGQDALWGRRLLAALAAGLAVAALVAWVAVFYLEQRLSAVLSYQSADVPRLPEGVPRAEPLVGIHYFGDLQEALKWGRLLLESGRSPYSEAVSYPPTAVVPMIPLSALPTVWALALVLAAMTVLVVTPAWLLLAPASASDRVVACALAVVITTPFLAILDRGNLQGLVIGSIGLALWAATGRRWWLVGGLLGLAIALKGYPVVLLLVPLALGAWRFAAKVALGVVVLSAALLSVLPGGLLVNARDLAAALQMVAEGRLPGSNYSFSGAASQVASWSAGAQMGAVPLLFVIPAALWLGTLWIVIRAGAVPQWCWGPLALASLQVVPPMSFPYSASWAILGAIWFIRGNVLPDLPGSPARPEHDLAPRSETALRWLMIATFVAALTPLALTVGSGYEVSVIPLVSPVLIGLTGAVALVVSLRPGSPTRAAAAPLA